MESPKTSGQKLRDELLISKANATPTNQKIAEEFSLYYIHKDSSPSFRAGQDVLEVGWGNSPEPLHIEKKSALNKTPVTCKKKLESKESPVSSISSKRRNLRSNLRVSSKSILDIAKYVAEVQELSKNIMKELNSNKTEKDMIDSKAILNISQGKHCGQCPQVLPKMPSITDKDLSDSKGPLNINQIKNCDPCPQAPKILIKPKAENCVNNTEVISENVLQNKDSAFDNVLQSFINEEDDWLSQAISSQDTTKFVPKISFLKFKSENELSVSQPIRTDEKNCAVTKTKNNNYRRTSSFDLSKNTSNLYKNGMNSGFNDCEINFGSSSKEYEPKATQVQYSQQEIERKRLEAIYRREKKEIERKKMEALKRLEKKKLRPV